MRIYLGRMIVVGIMALIVSVPGTADSPVWGMGMRPPVVGMPAPEFSLPDLDGRPQSLGHYKGKIVLLNFWATWCKPCTTEMPAMQACYDKLRDDGFVVLAIDELEDDHTVREHIRAHGHTFPVLLDRDNRVANQYGVFGLPVSVFVDETGTIQEYVKGGLLTEQKIQEIVSRIKHRAERRAVALG
ncbi:MAG: TlpA family protein disulfide reductase [Nitrospirae bacterium]|nr:TlpA family protein disulfide reductase [Nitrospirota bacterium]